MDPLQQVAHQGARLVALDWLARLTEARATYAAAMRASEAADEGGHGGVAPEDPAVEALHDARVALRRLRATLAIYRTPLDLRVGRRARTALRRLSTATGALRDADVQGAWLAAEGPTLPPDARAEADALRLVLRRDTFPMRDAVADAFRQEFDRTAGRLRRRLQHYTLACEVGHTTPWQPYGSALAEALADDGATLARDLIAVRHDERAALHRVRLGFKRHRALLAPFVDRHPAIAAWMQVATAGQNALGALRDLVMLRDVALAAEAPALCTVLTDRIATESAALHGASWLDPDTVTLLIADAALAVRSIGTGAPPTESAAGTGPGGAVGGPTGVPLEIERKWLLHGLPPVAARAPAIRIEQGWLPGTALRERLRRTVAADGSEMLTRTVKLGPAAARIEVEEPTSPTLFAALWPLTASARIRKRRHRVAAGDRTWEIDVFLDRDLVLAEIELASIDEPVSLPDWIASFVIREVTDDPAYLNVSMARPDPAPDSVR